MAFKKLTRRNFMHSMGMLGVAGLTGGSAQRLWAQGSGAGTAANTVQLPFENGLRQLVQYPQKRPLIVLTSDGIQLETPFAVFDENILTPLDAMFVRYHNARKGTPVRIDTATYRVKVTGNVATPLSLSLSDLKSQFTPRQIVSAMACTGNSRGFVSPRVPGGQWGHGAMCNTSWTGVSLKDILTKAGIGAGALEVVFDGLDRATKSSIPDFQKSLKIDIAQSDDILVAYQANGSDLPMLNGYPVRLIVPGYTGTYWVKHLTDIRVVNEVFSGFYMSTAYREPDNDCACIEPAPADWASAPAVATRPVTHPRVRSFVTNLIDGAQVLANSPLTVRGFAFDGGSGIQSVMVSADNGATWKDAMLKENLGRYAFRGYETTITLAPGVHVLKVKAVAVSGETQSEQALWAATGYGYNRIEAYRLNAVA